MKLPSRSDDWLPRAPFSLDSLNACRLPLAAWAAVFSSLVFLAPPRLLAADPAAESTFRGRVEPLVRRYCHGCHGPKKQESDIALHTFRDAQSVKAARETWESVLEMIENRMMPPADADQPTDVERRQLIRSLERILFNLDCEQTQQLDPGRVTIRRLNRAEYNNTIRDLLGVDFRPADDFPTDDVGYGFDNIGDVLTVSPLLVEKYLGSAERVAAAAVSTTVVPKPAKVRKSGRELEAEGAAKRSVFGIYSIPSRGAVVGKFEVGRAGRYVVRVRAAGQRAGDELPKLEVRVDGREVRTFDVAATADKPADHDVNVTLETGARRIEAWFINDYYNPDAERPADRDRNLYVSAIELEGPLDAPASAGAPKFVIVRPVDGRSVADAARATLMPLVRRAFRRTVTADEVNRYVKLVELAVEKSESFDRGIEVAVTAVLVSPHFLFRVERDEDPNDPQRRHRVNDFELASRLSYFLWSSLPDDRLLELAEQGRLNQDEVLREQVTRLLADPRSRALAENFASQWLNLRGLEEVTPDPALFPRFSAGMKADLRRETELLFDAVVRENRSILDFLDADFTFVNERLARHYGMDNVTGSEFRRVSLAGTPRAGVLTQAGILTLTSNPTRTSPVKRGKWIMENILGTPPPEPPPNVPELAETQKASPDATLRQQLEIHRRDPNCAVCHDQMDTLGFGFENFDAVGRWRDRDGRNPIDAAGVLPDGSKFAGPQELVKILRGKKTEFSKALSERLLTYALGRGLESYDRCTIDKILERLEADEYRMNTLITSIVLSEPFRMRRGEASRAAPPNKP